MKISNTQLDLYETCGKKYYYRYIENLKGDYTSSSLLYGTAMDAALNYILESIRDKKEWSKAEANDIFLQAMEYWDHQNRLDFFKNEVPAELQDIIDDIDPDHQEEVWNLITERGLNSLAVYINDVLPLIDEVLLVQEKISVANEDGDTFAGVIDFICKLKDGRTVLMDNKTASTRYPKNKVVKSQQLSLYLESYPDIKYAGYIVLIKNPEKERGVTYQILVDEIPEITRQDSFERLDKALRSIKAKEFPPNYKSCMKFGKPCEFSGLCKYGSKEGLIPAHVKKDKTE